MNELTLIIITAAVIHVLVMYLLIKSAVESSTKRIYQQIAVQNNLRLIELQRAGVPAEEVTAAIQKAHAM